MLFLAFIFKRGAGYGDHAVLRSLITLQDPRRNLYAPIKLRESGKKYPYRPHIRSGKTRSL